MKESDLQIMVADYLRLQYPDVLFHSDFGSGVKLTPSQAIIQKRQNGSYRAWPDMFVAEPIAVPQSPDGVTGVPECEKYKFGLFLELKREGTRLTKKDGSWATEHIAEQADMLDRLNFRGYRAEFAVGFEGAKRIIDDYLKGVKRQ